VIGIYRVPQEEVDKLLPHLHRLALATEAAAGDLLPPVVQKIEDQAESGEVRGVVSTPVPFGEHVGGLAFLVHDLAKESRVHHEHATVRQLDDVRLMRLRVGVGDQPLLIVQEVGDRIEDVRIGLRPRAS
jgi:hypothetical protein